MSDALELLGGLVLDDGRRWGDAAQPWQWADAAAILDESASQRYHYLTRPRGGSKTADLAGVTVAALLTQAPARSRAYALAADRDQGGLLVDSVGGFVERTPGLGGALKVETSRVVEPSGGASLEVLPADEASAWGLRPWLAVVDELAAWKATAGPRRLWRAIVSALPKVPGSRLAVLTSPGDPAHWSHEVLRSARGRPERWRLSEVEGPVPWLDPGDLAEQEALLPAWEYARLVLGRWATPPERLTDADALRDCVTLDGPREHTPGRRYAVGLDVGLKRDATVAAVCSAERVDGRVRVALDRMAVWQGTPARPVELGEVEAWLLEAWAGYGRPPVVCDPWQAAQLAQRLRGRGVRTLEYAFTQQSVSRLALRLYQAISDRALALPDDPELLDELANVRLLETSPGVYRLDHDADKHDDRAVALGLAVQHLTAKAGGRTDVLIPRGHIDRRFGNTPGTMLARRRVRR